MIKVGDEIAAWGQPETHDNGVAVEKIWVNIVNIGDLISDVTPNASGLVFHLDDPRQGIFRVHFDEQTIITQRPGDIKYSPTSLQPTNGRSLQVIGLATKDKTVLARRVWFGK